MIKFGDNEIVDFMYTKVSYRFRDDFMAFIAKFAGTEAACDFELLQRINGFFAANRDAFVEMLSINMGRYTHTGLS